MGVFSFILNFLRMERSETKYCDPLPESFGVKRKAHQGQPDTVVRHSDLFPLPCNKKDKETTKRFTTGRLESVESSPSSKVIVH